ncbi:MAG: C4-dicarboxylate transporter DctA [Alphaproteobacteria bacterium]|nr:C4-dicarboxylate transporter DctA [Alphaproteobacteria bacterium]
MLTTEGPAVTPRRRAPFYGQLYFQVIFAIIAGGFVGAMFPAADNPWVEQYLNPLGQGFIKLVKMIIAPVIFLTITIGIAHMRDMAKLGRVALKAFSYFLFFSTLALIVGLVVANVVQPGAGMNVDVASLNASDLEKVQGYEARAQDTTLVGFLLGVIPDTFVGAFSAGNILQVLFISILFGVSLALVGDRANAAVEVMESLSQGVSRMVSILMRAAPIGAFGAFAYLISTQGIDAILRLGLLILSVWLTSFLFIVVVLGAVSLWAGFSIFSLIRYLKDELFLVLGTSSSESALPALIEKLQRAGCAKPIVGLVVPAGYSFNLDGTNIYMTLAALFIAQATNTPLLLGDQLILLAVAMLSSKGAAGVSGAGFITLAATLAVLPTVPVAGMALILGVDRFLSECRALTNSIGNAVATIVVSRWEGGLDRDMLKAALSGKPAPSLAPPVEMDPD